MPPSPAPVPSVLVYFLRASLCSGECGRSGRAGSVSSCGVAKEVAPRAGGSGHRSDPSGPGTM